MSREYADYLDDLFREQEPQTSLANHSNPMKTFNARTLPMSSLVTPREPILIGRAKAHPGQTFWVTDSAATREARGCIKFARSGKNSAHAQAYSFEDAEKFFALVSDLSAHDDARVDSFLP
jgi:hypothetical protein